MSIFNILLTALTIVPTNEVDTIQTERLDEVVVVSNSARQRIQGVQTGAEQLKLKELTASPQLFGERDIMRSLQLLAGVKAESDASSGFQVRGGTSAQNQILPSITQAIWADSSLPSMMMPSLQPPYIKDYCLHNTAVPHRQCSTSLARLAIRASITEGPLSESLRQRPLSKVLS